MRNSYSSTAIVLLGHCLLASSLLFGTGCRSLGKHTPLGSSDIPVLTRDEDVEYPPPSAAAAPTAISSGADSDSQFANTPSNLIANSGDQTTAGIEFPNTQPAASSAAAPSAESVKYPTTTYQAFPQQPEALGQSSNATQNTGGFVPPATPAVGHVATSAATPPNSANVQQGLYPVQPTSSPTTGSPTTGPATPATTAPNGGGNWPAPLATTEPAPAAPGYPVAQTTQTAPMSGASAYNSDRASEFGGGTMATTATSTPTTQPAPASPIVTYVEPASPGVAATPEVGAASHYEAMSTASTPSATTEWRPGSTSNLTVRR